MAAGVDKSLLPCYHQNSRNKWWSLSSGAQCNRFISIASGGGVPIFRAQCRYGQSRASALPQLVKKLAYGDFFDDFCTVCLGAYGSPGGKRR